MADDHSATSRFDGEDVSPTTEQELRGWYAIGLSAEIFAVCGVGSFAPVLLEQLARENGVLRGSSTPCVQPKQVLTRALNLLALRAANEANDDRKSQCVVSPFGRPISTASFAMYTFSTAVFAQALVLISFSPVADYGQYRKRMLLMFAFTGAGATALLGAISPSVHLLASVSVIIGVICLGSVFVLLNSYLPLLAARHPSLASTSSDPAGDSVDGKSTAEVLKLSTQISSKAVGLGYAAAVSSQILCILLLVTLKKAHFHSESTPLRFIQLMVGTFWFLFTIPGALALRDRPGPTLHLGTRHAHIPTSIRHLLFAWKSVWQTLRSALTLHQTRLFLLAWFILSDAIATVSGTAILFARTELHMSTIAIALLSITVTTSGIAGALLWPVVSRKYSLSAKHTMITCVLLMELIPLYGLLGFVPLFQRWGVIGLQQAWEIYPLGVIHGCVMGGISSYARALYGELIPPGREAGFFALYAITDKGSSAVGPAIVGMIVDSVGTLRPAFLFLAVLIALPIPLIYGVDVVKGRRDAKALSKQLDNQRQGISMYDLSDVGTETRRGLLSRNDDDRNVDE